MARLRAILDGGDTIECPNFTLPTTNTLTQKRGLVMSVESEYIELVYDDGNTGDTVSWGIRTAVVNGISQRRDLDL